MNRPSESDCLADCRELAKRIANRRVNPTDTPVSPAEVVRRVAQCLSWKCCDIDAIIDPANNTPLRLAAIHGNVDVVHLILDAKPSVSCADLAFLRRFPYLVSGGALAKAERLYLLQAFPASALPSRPQTRPLPTSMGD